MLHLQQFWLHNRILPLAVRQQLENYLILAGECYLVNSSPDYR